MGDGRWEEVGDGPALDGKVEQLGDGNGLS